MNCRLRFSSRHLNLLRFLATSLAVGTFGTLPNRAYADVSANVSVWHGYDFFYPSLNLSASSPPVTFHWMESSSGALWRQFGSTNGINGFWITNDLNAVIHECTNSLWKLYLNRGDVSEEVYYFKMSIAGVTTNVLGDVKIFWPWSGSTGVTNQPTFHWVGPSNLATVNLQAYHETSGNSYFAALPGTATNWTPAGALTPGPNTFFVNYATNDYPGITFTTPTNSAGVPLLNWSAQGELHTYLFSSFTVAAGLSNVFDAYLVARYDFEDTNSAGLDSSGNDNSANCSTSSGPLEDAPSTNAAIHAYARQYFGETSICFTPGGSAFPNLSNALAGNFSVTAWVNTTNSVNADFANAYFGLPILFAYSSNTNGTVPLTITGSKAAFTVSNPNGTDTTLHSTTSVNDGNYHFLAVTRNYTNGLMSLYVDGNLEATGFSSPQPLLTTSDIHLAGGYYSYQGLVDDVRIYSTDLTAGDVALLASSRFAVSSGHTNLAHYRFDNDGPGLGDDTSGNENHFNGGSSWGVPLEQFDADARVGPNAVRFSGNSSLTHTPPSEAFTNLTAALANSFSISLWLKTTAVQGNDNDDALDGATIIWNYDSGTDDIIPVAITGNKVAFHTGDESGNSQTLHSASDVTDGDYHHIVVTRMKSTGEKKIYVDGLLEATEVGTTRTLNANDYYLSLGGVLFHSFDGLVDDLQIYSGVLSALEVSTLYSNPGTTIPDTTGGSAGTLAEAVNATNLVWTTSGDTNWFAQNSISHDGVAAARSGAIGDNESTALQTQVYGTNILTFWWKTSTEENADYLEFYDNGNWVDSLSGDSGWQQYVYDLTDPGLHTLEWRYTKDGSGTAGQDAAFLDQVSLAVAPSHAPILFSMTLIRQQSHALDPSGANQVSYVLFPFIDSPGITLSQHRVESPNNLCHGLFGPTNSYSSSSTFISGFDTLANELTNGNWKVWLNKDTPQEEFYTFAINSVSFTSNSLTAFAILSPTNGGTGIPASPTYQWSGLTGWSDLSVSVRQERFGTNHYYSLANLTPPQNSWAGVPPLADGTNIFDIRYASNNRNADFSITTPFTGWSVSNIRYESAMASGFIVTGSVTPPPNLSIVLTSSNTVAVSWPSASTGFNLYANTNLATTNWTAVAATPADNGTTKTVVINPPAGDNFFRLTKSVP